MENKGRLLLVDDDESILKLYKIKLTKSGFDVQTADNGVRALEVIDNQLFDLILLDVTMPDMDGYEVCSWLQESKKNRLHTCYLFYFFKR